jgi:hypothetical protein
LLIPKSSWNCLLQNKPWRLNSDGLQTLGDIALSTVTYLLWQIDYTCERIALNPEPWLNLFCCIAGQAFELRCSFVWPCNEAVGRLWIHSPAVNEGSSHSKLWKKLPMWERVLHGLLNCPRPVQTPAP